MIRSLMVTSLIVTTWRFKFWRMTIFHYYFLPDLAIDYLPKAVLTPSIPPQIERNKGVFIQKSQPLHSQLLVQTDWLWTDTKSQGPEIAPRAQKYFKLGLNETTLWFNQYYWNYIWLYLLMRHSHFPLEHHP